MKRLEYFRNYVFSVAVGLTLGAFALSDDPARATLTLLIAGALLTLGAWAHGR
ncbi:MAG: hypothetical protein AAFR11_03630 [Pseudomonadota bacterium]